MILVTSIQKPESSNQHPATRTQNPMHKKYSTEDLIRLQNAMAEYMKLSATGCHFEKCFYCHHEKIEIWPDNFIPMCNSCNIEISQMLEYFFDKYPEMVEEILSGDKGRQ